MAEEITFENGRISDFEGLMTLTLRTVHMCACAHVSLCTTVVHNTAQNSSDYFPSKPPDNHHSSDAVCWRRAE